MTTPADLAAKLAAHPFKDVRENLMQKLTFLALHHAQPLTPWRTGNLRRSETTRVEPGGLRGWVGTNVVYAPFVHRRVPFFEQAVTDMRPEAERILQKAGDEYLKGLT